MCPFYCQAENVSGGINPMQRESNWESEKEKLISVETLSAKGFLSTGNGRKAINNRTGYENFTFTIKCFWEHTHFLNGRCSKAKTLNCMGNYLLPHWNKLKTLWFDWIYNWFSFPAILFAFRWTYPITCIAVHETG